MTPAWMRWLDYWVGIPACFLLTMGRRLRLLRGRRRDVAASPPRRILFIQLAEMGTMVVACPALQRARELFPEAKLYFLCFTDIRPSLESIGIIDSRHILTIDGRSLSSLLLGTLAFVARARMEAFDAVVNLEAFVRYSSILSFLTGAPRRVGFYRFNQEGGYTGDLLTHKVIYNPQVHAAQTFLDLVDALATPAGQVPHLKRPVCPERLVVPEMTVDEAVLRAVRAKLQGAAPAIDAASTLVVLNPNASERFPMRKLPLDSYVALTCRLIEDPSVYVIVTGVESEAADAAYICQQVASPRVVDLTGRTTLTELLHLFHLARVVITNDSGPAHFAALTRTHVIVFFGPETPRRYAPLTARCDIVSTGFSCSPCVGPHNQRLTPCNDNLCMKSIDVGAVYDLVRRHLQSPHGGPLVQGDASCGEPAS